MKHFIRIMALVMLALITVSVCACSPAAQNKDEGSTPASDTQPSPADSQPDSQPSDSKPADSQPADSKPADSQPVEGQFSIVGKWLAPDPINADYDEVWSFEDDGVTYHLYQVDSEGKVIKTLDGNYALKEGNTLDLTLMGYTLTYTYEIKDNGNTLTLSDHGTNSDYPKYTKSITN